MERRCTLTDLEELSHRQTTLWRSTNLAHAIPGLLNVFRPEPLDARCLGMIWDAKEAGDGDGQADAAVKDEKPSPGNMSASVTSIRLRERGPTKLPDRRRPACLSACRRLGIRKTWNRQRWTLGPGRFAWLVLPVCCMSVSVRMRRVDAEEALTTTL